MINICKECGCTCKNCGRFDNDIHLHLEIENLKQKLMERDNHIIKMETNFLNDSNNLDCDEFIMLKDEFITLQEKFKRLSEAHKRIQRVNQGLEDKLLKLVDTCETDKNALTKDVAILSEKLAEANYTVKKLTDSNERYKNDVNVAIQFLQCKQSNFVAHKFDSLPPEIQNEVSAYMTNSSMQKRRVDEKKLSEPKSIKVPIPTFPPTAMFYSVPKSPDATEHSRIDYQNFTEAPTTSNTSISPPSVDVVSAAIMAKVLEERQKERLCVKHCDTCTCSKNLKFTDPNMMKDSTTQTDEINFSSNNNSNCKNCEKKCTNFESLDNSHAGFVNNIVKVQPNNFLVEKSSSNASSLELENNSDFPIPKLQVQRSKPQQQPSLNVVNVKKKNVAIHAVQSTPTAFSIVRKSNNSVELDSTPTQNIVEEARVSAHNQKLSEFVETENESMKHCDEVDNRENFEIVDRTKYREMEEHVKMFLFKETELWKESSRVFTENETLESAQRNPDYKSTFSHTQTDI